MNAENIVKPCVVIPVYNHSQFVLGVYERIEPLAVFCIIVNDGSVPAETEYLRETFANKKNILLVEQFPNRGKGVAVKRGFVEAAKLGFTHAVQVDADGQHAIEDIPKMLDIAKQNPQAVVTGIPKYDASVPRARLYSRYITHFWVWVETLSFEIKDSMCGFRVYPIAMALKVLEHSRAHRMDFDTQIIVRLYWLGLTVISVPTNVIYPEDGVSNFRLWRDNLRISWMHTKLVFGMLLRFPSLFTRMFKRNVSGGAEL